MKKKIIITSSLFTTAGIAGWRIGDFGGGALFGAAFILLVGYTINKYMEEKTAILDKDITNLKNDYRGNH